MSTGKDALVSSCGRFRYWLTRAWDANLPRLCIVMLNPSTADADVDDPTIRKCVGFAKNAGYGSIVVANLYAFRATDPKKLKLVNDRVGIGNDEWIRALSKGRDVLVAWGAGVISKKRERDVTRLLYEGATKVMCLGTTKDGHPNHPCYLPYSTPLVPFKAEQEATTKT